MSAAQGYNFDPEVSKMQRLMRYTAYDYWEDWAVAESLALLMAVGQNERYLAPMLNSCMNRILAYHANHPDELPFEVRK